MYTIKFNHPLYGLCYLLPNISFKLVNKPIAFDFIVITTGELNQSSILDANFTPTQQTWMDLGYKINVDEEQEEFDSEVDKAKELGMSSEDYFDALGEIEACGDR